MRLGVHLFQSLVFYEVGQPVLVAAHVEPLLALALDGVRFLHLKKGDVAPHLDVEAANRVNDTPFPDIGLHVEDLLPQGPVGRDSQEALAEHAEARDAQ